MMSFERLLRSRIFTFIVGPDQVPIVVHSEAISRQSRILDILMNGSMTEAQTRHATLDDVGKDTFSLFCQFAYTGDYETPSCDTPQNASSEASGAVAIPDALATTSVAPAESAPDPEPPAMAEESQPGWASGAVVTSDAPADEPQFGWGGGYGRSGKKSKKGSKKSSLRESFEKKEYRPTVHAIQANGGPEEDFTGVFLAHARLYALAEKYGVEDLKKLILHKLHKTLVSFTLHETRIGDVIELARYVYSTENIPDQDQQIDELRALVVLYMVCEMDVLSGSEKFVSLLEGGGTFVRDFWMKAKSHFSLKV